MVQRLGEVPEPPFREMAAHALYMKAALTGEGESGSLETAIELFELLVERFGDAPERDVRGTVGSALNAKGKRLERLGRRTRRSRRTTSSWSAVATPPLLSSGRSHNERGTTRSGPRGNRLTAALLELPARPDGAARPVEAARLRRRRESEHRCEHLPFLVRVPDDHVLRVHELGRAADAAVEVAPGREARLERRLARGRARRRRDN